MKLNYGLVFKELYEIDGLKKIDNLFLSFLSQKNYVLYNSLLQYRLNKHENSELIIEISYYLDAFIKELFFISTDKLDDEYNSFSKIYKCNRLFIQKIDPKLYLDNYDLEYNFNYFKDDQDFAEKVLSWLEDEEKYEQELKLAKNYALFRLHNKPSILFSQPNKIDYDKLVNDLETNKKQRSGFDLLDNGFSTEETSYHLQYCLYCHKRYKDSCSKGFFQKNSDDFIVNSLGNSLSGCPLKQKISEMNFVKSQNFHIAALAIIMIDNPLVAITGHRICNDCKKSCIFQKQMPVEIPQIETKIFKDILEIDYGFEIYSLLTKWNPLKNLEFLPQIKTNKSLLIAGAGPAGFSLAYYMLHQGHNVMLLDGNKIEPLLIEFEPIKNIELIFELISNRVQYGFGGVAEYGITSRWNKNYLTVIRIILTRNNNFLLLGGLRIGGNINYDQIFNLGFAHISLCTGASKQKVPDIKNILAKGSRSAADFLMALQLTGASIRSSFTNLQIRMPLIVIGAGLTAIDAATESIAYYKIQIAKFAENYNHLVKKFGKNCLDNLFSSEEKIIIDEFLADYEKQSNPLVSICYHKKIQDSAAYKINHEELQEAIDYGIKFYESMQALEVITDIYDHVEALKCLDLANGLEMTLPAKTILFAIGNDLDKNNIANILKDDRFSVLGDASPSYRGSVVKAVASAKNNYHMISQKINSKGIEIINFTKLKSHFTSIVRDIKLIDDSLFLLSVKSEFAAKNYLPGQFYKLANYQINIDGKKNIMAEAVALNPFFIEGDYIDFLVSIRGKSTKIYSELSIGDEIILMGPNGESPNFSGDNILILTQGVSSFGMNFVAKNYRDNGKNVDLYGIVSANYHYLVNNANYLTSEINLDEIVEKINLFDDILISVSPELLQDIFNYIKNNLAFYQNKKIMVAVHSLMQCMMQEICAACLQEQRSGEKVHSCRYPYQNFFSVDFNNLISRLKQNSLLEKITNKI